MELNAETAAGLGFGVLVLASGALVFRRALKKLKPQIEFLDVIYDKANKQLELFIVNESEKPVYVNPSVRLVHFLEPDEWREKKGNGNGNGNGNGGEHMLPGKSYQVDSVIKGYSLIGEAEKAMKVDGRSVRKIIYPISDDVTLKVYDNIRVDSPYGFKKNMNEHVVNTMRVITKEDVDGELLEVTDSSPLDGDLGYDPIEGEIPSEEGEVLIQDEDPITPMVDTPVEVMQNDSYSPNFCIVPDSNEGVAVENAFPVHAMCVCCGQNQLLEWIVNGNHVCTDCKEFMHGTAPETPVSPELQNPVLSESDAQSFVDELITELELAYAAPAAPELVVDDTLNDSSVVEGVAALTRRQIEILNLLENENNLTVRKISDVLDVSKSTASSDLKSLIDHDLVGRIEIGKKHLYHLA